MQKETFLKRAEGHLKDLDISISARANAIAELSNRIENNSAILKESPIKYTNRLLLEMNIEIPRKKVSGFSLLLKFVFASFILFFVLLGIAYYKFSPLLKITDDRVVILGGLIDIDAQTGSFKVDSHYSSNLGDQQVFKGSSNTINKIAINAQNAQLHISCSANGTFAWNCKSSNEVTSNFVNEENGILNFNMKDLKAIECQISIPLKKEIELDAKNINVALDKVCSNIDIDADNGTVIMLENPEVNYSYDLKVSKGFIENFNNAKVFDYKIKVDIDNGSIIKKI